MTVKEECGLKAFWEWPAELRTRGEASAKVCADHPARMLYHQMTQYFFDRQWSRLKAYANERDILIIGDLPMYVAPDSADVWAQPAQEPENSSSGVRNWLPLTVLVSSTSALGATLATM